MAFKLFVSDGYVEPEKLVDDSVLVETAGYVPREKSIENLILSGQRLLQSRMEEYDGKTVVEALENASVCRVNDFDIVDSVNYLHQLQDSSGKRETSTDGGVSVSVNESNESGGSAPDSGKVE